MTQQFTANEVREELHEFLDFTGLWPRAGNMLRAFADRLEADEKAEAHAAIKQREQDAKDAARWRKFMDLKSAWVREPLVNARTGEEIHGSVRWTIWMHEAPDMPTVEGAVDAAMAQESGDE